MLSDSTNGYVSKFKPYTGKSATGPSMNGATYDLVMNLMRGLFEKGYNFYRNHAFIQRYILMWSVRGEESVDDALINRTKFKQRSMSWLSTGYI
jgi:hypothetical protein